MLIIYSDVLSNAFIFPVVPLLLLFCLCGGGAGAGDFKPIPFDNKQQLISYHTEGQGEDKVLWSGAALIWMDMISCLKYVVVLKILF